MDGICLGEIWCPYPARLNALVSVVDIEDRLFDWAVKAGLLDGHEIRERFRQARFGECAAYVYPDAPDLLVYAKWCAWLFLVDDEFDENRAPDRGGINEGVLPYLPVDGSAPAAPTGAVTAALVDLWSEIATGMSDDLRRRFRRHADVYCHTYGTDIARARTGNAPSLAAYIELRRNSGAVETCIDLIERGRAAAVMATPENAALIDALRTAANDVICWTNDVASVAKEVSYGELNNLVAVLHQTADMSWEKAQILAARMTSARTRDFDAIQRRLFSVDRTPEARAFAEGLQHWISGSLAWHKLSPRYAGEPAIAQPADHSRSTPGGMS
jgi:hypothetical protein